MISGPIILVEDDADDKSIVEHILKDLDVSNQLVWFSNSDDAFDYLQKTEDKPFIILSDINLPKQNGLEFKQQIDNNLELKTKSIPFLFYSTSIDQDSVNRAYTKMTVQGFFQKGHDYEEIKNNIKIIIDYWTYCKHPNTNK